MRSLPPIFLSRNYLFHPSCIHFWDLMPSYLLLEWQKYLKSVLSRAAIDVCANNTGSDFYFFRGQIEKAVLDAGKQAFADVPLLKPSSFPSSFHPLPSSSIFFHLLPIHLVLHLFLYPPLSSRLLLISFLSARRRLTRRLNSSSFAMSTSPRATGRHLPPPPLFHLIPSHSCSRPQANRQKQEIDQDKARLLAERSQKLTDVETLRLQALADAQVFLSSSPSIYSFIPSIPPSPSLPLLPFPSPSSPQRSAFL